MSPGSLRSAAVGTNADKHARQKERRGRVDEARRQVQVKERRRRQLTIVGVVLAVLIAIGAVVALTGGNDEDEAASTTSTTTGASSHTAPALTRSSLIPGEPVTRTPR